jgi:hypothetical protein
MKLKFFVWSSRSRAITLRATTAGTETGPALADSAAGEGLCTARSTAYAFE